MERYLTTKQVAKELNRTTVTIYNYVKKGKLKPVTDHDKYPMRREKYFHIDDVLKLKKELQKTGYTTTTAARILNVTPNTIYNYIKEGKIKAERIFRNGKMIYSISEEEMERFRERFVSKGDTKPLYYIKSENIYLFQPFIQFGTQKIARVVEIDARGQVFLKDEDGRKLYLPTAIEEKYKPIRTLVDLPLNQKKGEAVFHLPYEADINALPFNIIDWLMEHIGYRNMNIEVKQDIIQLSVNPTFIQVSNHQDFISYLEKHCVEGNIEKHVGGIQFDSGFDSIAAYVPRHIKQWIVEEADKKDITQSDFINEILESAYKS